MKSEWTHCTIGDLCNSISETYKRDDEKVVLINTSDVLDGKILNHHSVENNNLKGQFKKTFQMNDILYSEIRPANKRYAFVDFEDTYNYIASTKLMVIRPDAKKILPQYLFAILRSEQIISKLQLLAETRSGTFPQITFNSELAPIPVTIPDMETQRDVVLLLSCLDGKIELNNQINENLQQQAQAIFREEISKSQNEVPFTQYIKVLGGGTPKTDNPDYWNGTIPFFTPKDIGTPYVLETLKYITEKGLNNCNSRLYPVNTTFVTARGTVGKVSLAGVPMAMNQSCYALASDTLHPILVYLYALDTVESLKHKASGAVFDAIVTKDFESEKIRVLPDEAKIIGIVKLAFEKQLSALKETAKLVELRDSLLQRLMTGEITVSEE